MHIYASCGVWKFDPSKGLGFGFDKEKGGRVLAVELTSSFEYLRTTAFEDFGIDQNDVQLELSYLPMELISTIDCPPGTSFDFLEVEKANLYRSKGYIYFITFVAKDPCHQTKVFQAKVCNVFCREIEHSFCRLKPGQQVECDEDSKRVVKKPRYNTRSNKRADVGDILRD
ncbi:hypothetical protein F2Q68_00003284 [Brassica cretica]|uniref:Cystatin domain-containing protein n=1 Tax=Brassica cretica TaxID=69181 RepID=A0A8S9JM24_BRACR|nr:hypothetical protein F2Q68_00003284 [Brassica cretica]